MWLIAGVCADLTKIILNRGRLAPRGAPDDATLIRHLPYVTALTDDVLLLRDGEIMATFAVDGIGAATAESVLVGDVAAAVQAVVAGRAYAVLAGNTVVKYAASRQPQAQSTPACFTGP